MRLGAGKLRHERVAVTTFVGEIAATGMLLAEYRHIRLTVDAVDPALAIEGDPQMLASAVMNLVQNAFKYTPDGGAVVLRARARGAHLLIEIEDQCGGIPETRGDLFQPFGDRRGRDRSRFGLHLLHGPAVGSRGGACAAADAGSGARRVECGLNLLRGADIMRG